MLALVAWLMVSHVDGDDADTIKGSTVPSSWATCDGEPADLRPDAPLLVLSDAYDLDSDFRSPWFTAFVLYRDGRLIVRRGFGMEEWRLSTVEVKRILERLHWADLLALDKVQDVRPPSPWQAEVYDGPPPETFVNLWHEGCPRTIRIPGFATLLAGRVFESYPDRRLQQQRAEARAMLKALPPVLKVAIDGMLAGPSDRGRVWCGQRGRDLLSDCFQRGHTLPYQDLWDGSQRGD